MEVLIITGMSGAGKTQATNALEDMGYYCVDNIPPSIIPSFIELFAFKDKGFNKLAIGTDVRGGQLFSDIVDVLDLLKKRNINYNILFLDATNDRLINRYKENRRRHPLSLTENLSIEQALIKERELLSDIYKRADYIIDTTDFSAAQLKQHINSIFLKSEGTFAVQCVSFGYKYGIPKDADLVFDVRCLPNPFYVDNLKNKTGLEGVVQDYVLASEESVTLLNRIVSLLDFSLPLYIKEGKSQLVIAFGCTGGHHRSVTFAEKTAKHLADKGFSVSKFHRDINKN